MNDNDGFGPPKDPSELWRETWFLLAVCVGGILLLGLVVLLLA